MTAARTADKTVKTTAPTAAASHASRRSAALRRAQQRRQPRLSRLLAWLLSAVLGSAGLAYAQVPAGALPSGGRVVVGSGQVQQSSNLLIINQSTQRLGMDWQSFNIGSAATVEFRQPGASSIALNRVVGNSGSEIYGRLRANGQVFLTNPNGVLFAPGSQVDVGGLVASTLDLSQQDFANGNFIFKADGSNRRNGDGSGNGSVVNQGTLRASAGGYLALFGNRVDNQGEISVDAGAVVLASGRAATVSISGSGLISAVVTPGAAGSVSNSGSIAADGGVVTMTAQSAQDMAASLVNNSGIVRANTLVERHGEVWITGDQVATSGRISADATGSANAGRVVVKGGMQGGSVQVGGSISAQADSGRGGDVETSAAHVGIAADTRVNTLSGAGTHGTWTIDPLDFTVAAGGGAQTTSGIGASTLSNNLNSGNVSLVTDGNSGTEFGDINVNAAVSWTAGTRLTLTATRNININANLTATGIGAALVMTPGNAGTYTLASAAKIVLSGARSGLQVAGITYTMIRDVNELQAIDVSDTTRGGNYALASDIDATATSSWNNNSGFNPIGDGGNAGQAAGSFTGRFDGLGNSITGLFMNRSDVLYLGLFGRTTSATLRNVRLEGGSITGTRTSSSLVVGPLAAGPNGNTVIDNAFSSVTVNATSGGTTWAGGLVGSFENSTGSFTGDISRSSASGSVTAQGATVHAGGLVGAQSRGRIIDSSASGSVSTTGTANAGGLVGWINSPSQGVLRGAATGSVTVSTGSVAGGLVGRAETAGSLSNVSATGSVTGSDYVGGLVGYAQNTGIVSGTAAGAVTANVNVNNNNTVYAGGLVGHFTHAITGGQINTSSASGNVSSAAPYGNVGGLVGLMNAGSVLASSASGRVEATHSTINSRSVGGLVGNFDGTGALTSATATGAVSGGYYTGGLVGYYGSTGNISTARADGNVTGSAFTGTQYVGGLIGQMSSGGSITASEAHGRVNTNFDGGGLVGYWYNSGNISDSRATGDVVSTVATASVGGLIGYGNGGGSVLRTINNSSATGNVSGGQYTGGLVGLLYYTSVTRGTAGTATSSVTVSGDSTVYAGGLVGYYYNYLSGSQIANSSAAGSVFADSGNSYAGGLVGGFNGGSIVSSNTSGNVTGRDSVNVNSSSHYVGGLVGQFNGAGIADSRATGAVAGRYYTGGLVGQYSGTDPLSNSSATGNVTGTQYVGGLVGYHTDAGITNGFASGAVSSTLANGYVGGLVGYAYTYSATGSAINDSRATGAVTGGNYTGGLIGFFDDYASAVNSSGGVSNSSASGAVSGNNIAGGLVGYYSGPYNTNLAGITNSRASGDVQGTTQVGGLVGQFQGFGGIRDSAATGNVLGLGSTSTQQLGGLVGTVSNSGVLTRNYATGNVRLAGNAILSTFTSVYAGGLLGALVSNNPSVSALSDSYATGAVTVTSTVGRWSGGGLVGLVNNASVTRTYATGAVSLPSGSQRFGGGLVGQRIASGSVSSSFWATDTTGQATSAGGTASTLALLKTGATFPADWDMATTGGTTQVWRIYGGQTTPLLRSFLTPLSLTLADVSKVYDGTASLGSAAIVVNSTAVANPERILVAGVSSHAGTYGLTAANMYSVQNGYDLLVAGTANLTIAPRPLTLAGLAANKVYDSTLTATVSANPQFGGLVAGEDLVFQPGSGFALQFASKTVGTGKTVNISGSYTLADGTTGRASDYVLPTATTATTTTANITPATLTAGSFSATNRAYDGTTTVAVSVAAATPSGVIGTDDVTIDLSSVSSGNVANKNVGTGKAVTVSGVSLTGADALNYTLAGLNAVSVDITPKTLTVNGISATDRQYDRSTSVTLTTGAVSLSGLVAGDLVQPRLTGLTGTMADKNVGTGKPVTVTGLGLRGVDAGNYSPLAGGVNVTITPRVVNLLLTTNAQTNRVYDGTTTASVLFYNDYYYNSSSVWGGDNVTITTTSLGYNDKNVAYNTSGVATAKPITASGISITGTDAANWAVQNTTTATQGTITPKPLAVSGVTATNRVYDGTRDVAVAVSGATVDTTAVVGSDVVGVATPGTGTVIGQMVNKNVGNAKAVTVPGLALTGADAGNYSITSGSGGGVTVNITPKDVAVSYTASDKVYDSGVTARTAATTTDFIAGDVVSFISNDYVNIYYGYNPWANFTGTGARNVGTAKTVTLTFDQLTSTDAANYRLANTALAAGNATLTTTASITPKPVTLAFSSASRVYDGSTSAAVTLNLGASGVFSVDALSSTQTAVYTGTGAKNVGTNKPISVSGISLSGTGAGNYTVGNTTATTTGTVTAKPVTVSGITATDRAYDGTTTVAVTAGTVSSAGFVAGDAVAITLPGGGLNTGTIANKNVGTNKPVTVTGLTLSGGDALNYSIDAAGSGITVNITQLALTPTYTGVSRVYNGGVSASVTSTTAGIASGDTVTFSQQAIFTGGNARDVGTAKPISISNIVIGGAGAANYSLAGTTATTSADITPKLVTAGYSGASRIYNGVLDVSAAVVGSSLQFVAGDSVGLMETARFTGDGSAGVNKAVSISGISLTGAQAANYSLVNTTASTTATIAQRPLGVTGITATGRVYDGTTTVAVNVAGATVDTSAVIAGDVVSVSLPLSGISTGTLADRNVGNNKPVAITGLTLGGSSAANYSLIGATGLTANITPRGLTAVYGGVSRVYDGTADALVTATSGDILAIDALSLGFNAQGLFTAGKDVGTGKAVSVISAFLTGASRDNYLLANTTGSTTANITPRTLTANYGGGNKVYDGSTSAVVTGTLANRIAGDNVVATQTAVFTGAGARNVGNGKPISVSSIALAGSDAGNYLLANTTDTTTGSITPKPITVSGLTNVAATDRVYDGTRVVTVTVPTGVTLVPNSSDIVSGDVVTIDVPVSGITTGTVANKNVANGKAVTVDGLTLTGTDAGNYSIGGTAGISVNISPKSLTASYSGVNRVYDGSTAASVTGASTDLISGDSLLIRGSGIFTGVLAKNVGTAKAINITSANLSGTDAGNYTLVNGTGSTTADVTQRTITPTYAGGSRVYDGSTAAPVSSSTANFVVGDSIALAQSASFTGSGARNAGTGKAIQITGITLTGSDAINYRLLTSNASTVGTITPKPISLTGLTGVTANDRVYDGTRTVGVTVTSNGSIDVNPADIVAGDIVGVVPPTSGLTTGTMLNKNAGLSKALVVDGLALTGADAGNYTVSATNGITVNIAPKSLVAVYTGVNRVYDGTSAATVVGTSAGVVAGDSLSISGSGVFSAGKNAGTGKAISVTGGVLGSTDAANYALLNGTGSARADITPRAATVSYQGGTRVYDGTTAAPVSGTLGGLVSGDSVSFSQTAVFSGTGAKNVGAGKAVDVSGISLSGTDAINYSLLNTSTSTTGSITPRPLGILGLTGVTAADRIYDGTRTVAVTVTTTGTVTLNPADLIAGDVVTITAPPTGQTTGTLADKNVGSAKAVAVAGLLLGGTDAGNYSVASTSGVTVNITPKSLTASYAGVSRVYDGTTAATATASSADIVAGDSVLIRASGVFSGSGARNAGVGKTIDVQNGALSSTDAGNYSLVNPTGTTTADITPRSISASYTGGTRVYDGTTAAPVTRTASGLIAGDVVSVSESAIFSGAGAKNVGSGKAVLVSGILLSGTDAANYALTSTSATTTGGITARPLNVTGLSGITAVDRVYDGTLNVQVNVSGTLGTASGDVIAGDNVTVNLPGAGLNSGTMLDKHVGQGKAVVLGGLSLSGADAGNYSLAGTAGLSVNITPKTLTASYTGANKVYDGTPAASITGSSSDLVAGDAVTIAATGVFSGSGARNVGSAKPVAVQAATLSGADAGNYTLVVGNTITTADITPRAVSATYVGGTRVYDGTATATVVRNDAGLITGDAVAITETAVFTGSGARNVGAGKGISITAITLSGVDAGNYALLSSTASTSGSITPRPLNVTGLSGITATDRVYDGTTAVQVSISGSIGSVSGDVIAGDAVTVNVPGTGLGSAVMLDKNAGQNKSVVLSGLYLSGADAANYAIAGTAGVTVNIARATVTLSGISTVNRVYDGTLLVSVNTTGGSISGALAGDNLQLLSSGVSGSMADKHAGLAKAVNLSGLSLGGTDAGNYTVAGGSGLTVNIAQRTLNAGFTVADKTYDGTTGASITLRDDRVAGDAITLTPASAAFAGRNAGASVAVAVTGLALSGADAGDYQLSTTTLSGNSAINRAALTVAANSITKVYGDTLNLTGSEFSALGLVAGETLGQVTLSSAGAAGTAAASASPYALTIGSASGGTFNPLNYNLSYRNGQVVVNPRPLIVAVNSLVRFSGEANPVGSFGLATNAGGLVNGDALTPGQTAATPAGSNEAAGVAIYALLPSNLSFAQGSASNYALSYSAGQLLVLPRPPQVGETDAGGGGGVDLALGSVSPEQILQGRAELDRAASGTRNTGQSDALPTPAAAMPVPTLTAAQIGMLLSGDAQRITLPELQKMPLIVFDPQLRRLMQPAEAPR